MNSPMLNSPVQTPGASRPLRIGVIGYGYIGRHVVDSLRLQHGPHLSLAFVHARDPARLQELAHDLVAPSLADVRRFAPDLIVECAHPDITRRHGADFLSFADYLPLSVNALADPATEAALDQACAASGRRLFIPHGALIGLDNLVELRGQWREVTITFRKHPDNIDYADAGIERGSIREKTVLYDGPTRGIAHLFPRNVNTMTTCALATVGLDRCRAVLIADPELTGVAIAEVRAVTQDGSIHESRKQQRMSGVSGTEMLASQLGSILRAAGHQPQGINFV
ncbi:MAG: aspartate dehydrogenase domain-containing protein [Lautropia sp.]